MSEFEKPLILCTTWFLASMKFSRWIILDFERCHTFHTTTEFMKLYIDYVNLLTLIVTIIRFVLCMYFILISEKSFISFIRINSAIKYLVEKKLISNVVLSYLFTKVLSSAEKICLPYRVIS